MAALASAPYLGGGPVWDDHSLILADLALRPPAALLSLWTSPVGGEGPAAGYYRPLAMTLLALLGRLGIPAVHLAAGALHVGSTLLLYRLLRGAPGALLGAAVFAVHPLAGEVLGWASALPDALAVFFALLACVLASSGRSVLPAVVLVLGVLCKETALLPLPFVALAGRISPGVAARAWLPAALLALAARLIGGVGAEYAVARNLALAPAAVLWSVVPWPLTAVRDLLAVPAWVVPAGAAVLVGMAVLAGRRREGWAGLGLILAAPVLALPPTLDGYLAAERYAYAGLVGWAMVLGGIALPWQGRRALVAGLGVAGVGLHLWRGPQWRGDEALFAAAARALPASSYAWHFLGVARGREGRPAEAADALVRAVEAGHPHPADYELALRAMVEAGQAERAVAWAEAGPREELTAEYLAWWARAAADTGRREQARALLGPLRTEAGGWEGPGWVAALAESLEEGG